MEKNFLPCNRQWSIQMEPNAVSVHLVLCMSLTGFVLNEKESGYDDAIKSIDGNICRCTGYKSIERAAKILSDGLVDKPKTNTTEWLIKNNFIPAYFIDIKERLLQLKTEIEDHVSQNKWRIDYRRRN